MPKLTHEALVALLRNAPTLLAQLLWPERQVSARSVHIAHDEFVDVNLAEYRDDVVLIGDEPDAPEAAIIGEAQTNIDPMKRLRWPSFVTGMFARYGCDVDLVVVTLDRKVAAWAARPIQIGRLPGGLTLTPTVIGPDQIPARLSPEQAHRMPELAVLSALAHAGGSDAAPIALTAVGRPAVPTDRRAPSRELHASAPGRSRQFRWDFSNRDGVPARFRPQPASFGTLQS